jgi:transcriptional regulator with XRE-family HTH domain
MPDKNDLSKRIGGKLKGLRKSMGLSMKQLAEGTGLSTALFSRIENGLIIPSIPTLQRISDFLKVDIGSFFDRDEKKGYVISRPGERKVEEQTGNSKNKTVYRAELLAEGMDNIFMEPTIVTVLGKDSDIDASSHVGQEFTYVLEGKVQLTLGSKKFILKKGDAAYYNSSIPHKGTIMEDKAATVLNVHLVPGKRTGTSIIEK